VPAIPAFLAFEPAPALWEIIASAKERVRHAVGPQKYLGDPPHITIGVSCFPDLADVATVLSKLAPELSVPEIQLNGWSVFRDDPLTGGSTMFLSMTRESAQILRLFQERILGEVSPLRDAPASTERYLSNWGNLSTTRQASTCRFGYPFTGEDWEPHISVASISKSDWVSAWKALQTFAPQGNYELPRIVLYELSQNETPTRIAEFSLHSRWAPCPGSLETMGKNIPEQTSPSA
jgi:hypothetical protein